MSSATRWMRARPAGGRQGALRDWWSTTESAAWDARLQQVATLYDGFAYPQLRAT